MNACTEDQGEYTVTVASQGEQTVAMVTVHVDEKQESGSEESSEESEEDRPAPQFEISPESMTLVEGDDLKLTCKVKGQHQL